MYNIFTQWITLSVIFFVANYLLEIIEVVTLGGLVAGSALLGVWTTAAERVARRLPAFTGKAAVVAALIMGVQLLCQLLPGYSLETSGTLVICLVIYGAVAILIGKLLD